MRTSDRHSMAALRNARILVLDDDPVLTATLVNRLNAEGLAAFGYVSADDFMRDAKAARHKDIQLIFLDMYLGRNRLGDLVTAVDIIPFIKTYAPSSRSLIFTHKGISLDDCIRCVELGALGLIPKPDDIGEFLMASNVYSRVGDPAQATEAVIAELWRQVNQIERKDKGLKWEMLLINLLSTVSGISVTTHNRQSRSGESDLVLRSDVPDAFWMALNSLNIIVECKHRDSAPEKSDFWILFSKVRDKLHCRVGIMVSWVPVSRGFRSLQSTEARDGVIFALSRQDVELLISITATKRQKVLTDLISSQL